MRGIRLDKPPQKGIVSLAEMKQGQVGEVVSHYDSSWIGMIVVRQTVMAVQALGVARSSDDEWMMRVRLLEDGERLVVG